MSLIKYPYTNLHEINLDWLIEKVKEAYSPDNPPDMAVLSVNGMTGDVTLYTNPAVTFPAIQGNSWNIGRTAGGTTVGIKFNKTLPLQRVNGTSLFNIYDEGNPPPYPVTSVNGRTGAVNVQEAFFSLSGNTITFITDSPGHFWALDRATLDGSISLKLDTTNNTPSAYLEYLSADETVYRTLKLLTPDDIPSSSGVVSVNGMAGVVSLDAEDIPRSGSDTENVNHALEALEADSQVIHDNIGNVGATSLQSQVNTINIKMGNVGNTPLQTQINNLSGQLSYKAGDIFSMRGWHVVGRVINNGQGIFCWIDLGKPCTAQSFNVTFGTNVNIFGISGATPTRTISNPAVSGNELSFVIVLSTSHTPGSIAIAEFDAEIELT